MRFVFVIEKYFFTFSPSRETLKERNETKKYFEIFFSECVFKVAAKTWFCGVGHFQTNWNWFFLSASFSLSFIPSFSLSHLLSGNLGIVEKQKREIHRNEKKLNKIMTNKQNGVEPVSAFVAKRVWRTNNQRTLTIRGKITVWLTFYLTVLDWTKQVIIQQKQSI